MKQGGNELTVEFHVGWDQAVMDLRRYHVKPSEDQLLVDYLDKITAACAKYLEFHKNPESLEQAMKDAESWLDIEQAYAPKTGGVRTRAT